MRSQLVLRWAAFAAVAIATIVAAVVLLRSGEGYTVHARVQNDPRTTSSRSSRTSTAGRAGGERMPSGQDAGCIVQPREQFQGQLQPTFPHIEADQYGPR